MIKVSIYTRILDKNKETIAAYKHTWYPSHYSIREYSILKASELDKEDIVWQYPMYTDPFPVCIQIVKKRKNKNGDIIKKVIYERIILE